MNCVAIANFYHGSWKGPQYIIGEEKSTFSLYVGYLQYFIEVSESCLALSKRAPTSRTTSKGDKSGNKDHTRIAYDGVLSK